MRVLITGATGFTARYLRQRLQRQAGLEVYCTDLQDRPDDRWFAGDLCDEAAVSRIIQAICPQQIYHLAGSFSNSYPIDYNNNALSTKCLLDRLLQSKLDCRVLLIGSAAEYGLVAAEDNPVSEDHPLQPVSMYGLTKVFQTHLMHYYVALHQLDLVMARPFNLLGKGMSNKLFVGRLLEQIDAYQQGRIPKIVLGNLSSKRDYLLVEEAIRDYEIIMNHGLAGEIYNVGSGQPITMFDLAQDILREHQLSMDVLEYAPRHTTNKIDIPEIYADIRKLSRLKNSLRINL